MSGETEQIIKIRSKEGEEFSCKLKSALLCQTISEMLDTLGTDPSSDDFSKTEVPLETVSSKTLAKVIDWLDHNNGKPQPTSEEIKEKTAEKVDAWDDEYMKMELEDLYNVITAANFLNVPGLLWLGTREIAQRIKNKTAEEVRQTFKIENDWTPEELEQVKRENQWCEEK